MGGVMGGVLGAVDNVLGTDLTGAKGRDAAIGAQTQATDRANEIQLQMYNQQREDLAPWRAAGANALSSLNNQMGDLTRNFTMNDFQQDPGYQFRMDQANQALERSAAARGGLNSGGFAKALTRYNQDYASNEYQNAYNRFQNNQNNAFNKYASLAGVGQTATGQLVNSAGNYGNAVSNNYTNLGNASAAAHINASNQANNLLAQGTSAAMLAFSDERLKTNIQKISKAEITELKETLTPYLFNYANDVYGEGDWVGVMAQDLEKSRLGKTIVEENEDGFKYINMNKLGSMMLAVLAGGE